MMVWADTAEQLKHELTDKYVVVMEGVSELKRFEGRTGTVKTVNMNGRALVQFEAPADISWYDIDPSYLTVIDAPLPKQKSETPAAEKKTTAKVPSTKKASSGKGVAKKGGLSPLEMARQQGAGGGGAKTAKPAESGGGKKLSPLELARQQGAASKDSETASVPAKSAPAESGKKLSPLELARQQGAAKQDDGDAPTAETPQVEVPSAKSADAKPVDTAGLSPLELARQQGAFKG